MSCRIYLIRHGETAWNKNSRLQGQADIPLSNRGVKQAEALCHRLSKENFTAIYSSSLKRAKETAAIIARPHNKLVNVMSDLQEINFGEWEGLTVDEISKQYKQESADWWARPLETRVPGGETLAELAERSVRAINTLIQRYPEEQVAVVAHGGTIKSIVGVVLGLDLNQYWRLRQDNASLSIVEYYGIEKGILMLYNDCCHLEKAGI